MQCTRRKDYLVGRSIIDHVEVAIDSACAFTSQCDLGLGLIVSSFSPMVYEIGLVTGSPPKPLICCWTHSRAKGVIKDGEVLSACLVAEGKDVHSVLYRYTHDGSSVALRITHQCRNICKMNISPRR